MNPDSLVNALVDFANGDISREVAKSTIEAELEKCPDLKASDKQKIMELIESYLSSGDIADFVPKVSEILGSIPEVAEWAAENKE